MVAGSGSNMSVSFGKLRIRFERSVDTHLALLTLACAAIYGAIRRSVLFAALTVERIRAAACH